MQEYKTYYQILGIHPDAAEDDIKKAFRRVSRIYHPDFHNNSERSNIIFRMVLSAYKTLSDGEARAGYDSFLARSSYLRRFAKEGGIKSQQLSGPVEADFLDQINITLWEIEDLINTPGLDFDRVFGAFTVKQFLLVILTFLDKWILGPSGFPDYFMEARRKDGIDPRDYIALLSSPVKAPIHLPYSGLTDYFYDIRKRTDKFLTFCEKRGLYAAPESMNPPLDECISEFHNLAVHYLGYLLLPVTDMPASIPVYKFRNPVFA